MIILMNFPLIVHCLGREYDDQCCKGKAFWMTEARGDLMLLLASRQAAAIE